MSYDKLLYEAYGYLDEDADRLRRAERAYQASPSLSSLISLMTARRREGTYMASAELLEVDLNNYVEFLYNDVLAAVHGSNGIWIPYKGASVRVENLPTTRGRFSVDIIDPQRTKDRFYKGISYALSSLPDMRPLGLRPTVSQVYFTRTGNNSNYAYSSSKVYGPVDYRPQRSGNIPYNSALSLMADLMKTYKATQAHTT